MQRIHLARAQSPAKRTAVSPAQRVAAVALSPPPPRKRSARRRTLPLLAWLALALAAAAALHWLLRFAVRRHAVSPAAAALAAPRCAASADAAALAALAMAGPVWREWAAALAEELAQPRAASTLAQQKADVGASSSLHKS